MFKTIPVLSDISDFDEDQKARIPHFLYGRRVFDHHGQYRTREGELKDLARIHFLRVPPQEIPGASTDLAGFDSLKFDTSPAFVLEAKDGTLTGWRDARENISSQWHYGLILKDDASGATWFYGYDSDEHRVPKSQEIEPDAKLMQISGEVSAPVLEENGPLENGLYEGEFWFSEEKDGALPVITSIPWWSEGGSEPPIMGHVRDRIAMTVAVTDTPAPV